MGDHGDLPAGVGLCLIAPVVWVPGLNPLHLKMNLRQGMADDIRGISPSGKLLATARGEPGIPELITPLAFATATFGAGIHRKV